MGEATLRSMGTQLHPEKRAHHPPFVSLNGLYCADVPLRNCSLTHHPTQFLAHAYCGQTAGWIKMPFGTEVNVGPGDVVLCGVAAPPKRGTAPSFRFMSVVAKRLDG